MTINSSEAQLKIGVFADCQYSFYENSKTRFYQNSKHKLEECVSTFNAQKLNFVLGLGDFIDKDFRSYDSILPVLNLSKHPVYHVIGNHDLAVDATDFEKVPHKLGLQKNYYSFTEKGWHFIFLNGNEITLNTNDTQVKMQAQKMLQELTDSGKPNNQNWNGGLGDVQLHWLKNQLDRAEKNKEKVAVFCHYPVYPLEIHCLWDYEKVIQLLQNYAMVKIWLNGHNHAGNYGKFKGIHFVNFKGMVDTETENAFSILTFYNNRIEIEGFGREKNRILEF